MLEEKKHSSSYQLPRKFNDFTNEELSIRLLARPSFAYALIVKPFISAAPVPYVVKSDTVHVGSIDFFPYLGVGGVKEHSGVKLR